MISSLSEGMSKHYSSEANCHLRINNKQDLPRKASLAIFHSYFQSLSKLVESLIQISDNIIDIFNSY